MDLQLNLKTALVTGSSKGIGEAIVRTLAREGANVVVHGRDAARTRRVADAIRELGGSAYPVVGDLTKDDDVERLIEDARGRFGEIGIVVNNAGGSGPKNEWRTTTPVEWVSAYDQNVLAAVRVTTRLLPAMRHAGWGRIINISSGAATMPPAAGPEYAAAKAAMNAMTGSMAKAVAAEGVTVNAVSPGTIRSARLEQGFRTMAAARGVSAENAPWDEVQRGVLPMVAHVPIGRVGELSELADAIAFLASPLAAYITGVNLRVDGGLSPIL